MIIIIMIMMMMMMMMMMMSRYGTDKLIQLLVEQSPAVYHYILYFQDRFSFALNPGTLGRYNNEVPHQ